MPHTPAEHEPLLSDEDFAGDGRHAEGPDTDGFDAPRRRGVGASERSTPPQPQGPAQTDRVIISAAEEIGIGGSDALIAIDDVTGELTAYALAAISEQSDATVLSWASSYAVASGLRQRFAEQVDSGLLRVPSGPQAVSLEDAVSEVGDHVVALMRLPKALHALEHRVRSLAAPIGAREQSSLRVVAGGRVKHMSRNQNDVLATVFSEVRASRGIGKSRALIGSVLRERPAGPSVAEGSSQVAVRGQQRPVSLRATGAVFGGARADAGSRLLLQALDQAVAAGELATEEEPVTTAVDLGCGNGLLSAYLAAALPESAVLGSDDDTDAVLSTRATLAANGLDREDVQVTWDDAISQLQDRSVDLVLLNPPFHDGTAIDATLVQGLLDAASRVLRPGGQLWFVHNSHLRFRTEVERRVGPVRQRARDRRFTVLSAQRA